MPNQNKSLRTKFNVGRRLQGVAAILALAVAQTAANARRPAPPLEI